MLPVTVVILTWNEEVNLAGCVRSARELSDDIVVVDSYSTDRTSRVAEDLGVAVYRNTFTGFGSQRNWAIDSVPHKYSWVLHLDADERITPSFVAELRDILSRNPSESGFFVPSKLMLGNQWLKYSGSYPVYQVRLFHLERLRFEDYGHGQREVTSGTLGKVNEPYLHYAFSKGMLYWFERHARYAAAEAFEAHGGTVTFASALRDTFRRDAVKRRRALKCLSYRLPFRGTLRLLHTLILKRGFLDGRAGFTYARMMAIYESMVGAYLLNIELVDGGERIDG